MKEKKKIAKGKKGEEKKIRKERKSERIQVSFKP